MLLFPLRYFTVFLAKEVFTKQKKEEVNEDELTIKAKDVAQQNGEKPQKSEQNGKLCS